MDRPGETTPTGSVAEAAIPSDPKTFTASKNVAKLFLQPLMALPVKNNL
jgi:hypothetical protein